MHKSISKRVKLPVLLAAFVLCSYLAMTDPGVSIARGQLTNRLEFVGVGVPLDKSTGTDDGAVFAVHFMGDTHGNLDTCG
ncbi:MAG TPA: hypothetical protein VNS63_12815 [Blastocatellia bacterium]|nr:hypothetical protein [Blastocatellia bacterium]